MSLTRRDWLMLAGAVCSGPGASAQSNVHESIRSQAEHAPLRMKFEGATAEEALRWQSAFSTKLREMLGPHRPPERWETIVERRVDLEDHRRDELLLRANGHPDLPLYLLTPKPSRTPAKTAGILALHGHGANGYDAAAGIAHTDEQRKAVRDANYDYGLQLVRQGYVVAIPCFTPFGRRLDSKEAYGGDDPCAVTFIRMQVLGKVLISENLRDALWAFELLAANEQVDPERIGCVGLSYGGRMTMLTAALNPRIRVAVMSGALNVMQERISHRYSCGAQVIPGLLEYGDVPEIAGLIAPRPCLWEIGNQDGLMVKPWIEPAAQRMRKVYSALGAEKDFQLDFFDGGHRWNGTKAYPLLDRVLKGA
jgi:dienelactone hydrolase